MTEVDDTIHGDEWGDEPRRDEREALLWFLQYARGAVIRKLDGVDDSGAHWRPNGALLPLIGIVNHLTHVEWRWIDGGFHGEDVSRSEAEFYPGPELAPATALDAYRRRGAATDEAVRALPSLDIRCAIGDNLDLRWVLLHLIEETARHAGHADATRELLDGAKGT